MIKLRRYYYHFQVDSTVVLYMLLFHGFNVDLFTINLGNREKRNNVEIIARTNILNYLSDRFNTFNHKYNIISQYPDTPGYIMMDYYITNMYSASLIKTGKYKYIAIGLLKKETEYPPIIKANIIRDIILDGYHVDVFAPLSGIAKEQVFKLLPPELERLTWSCRTPIKRDTLYEECGTCITCKETQVYRSKRTINIV